MKDINVNFWGAILDSQTREMQEMRSQLNTEKGEKHRLDDKLRRQTQSTHTLQQYLHL